MRVNILDNPYSDMLGNYITRNIARGQNGQFFTPETICHFIASIMHDSDKEGEKNFDPAYVSGRMLLAAGKTTNNNFFGADNDATCAKMTTINLFLNGLRGEITWVNSLNNKGYGGGK